MSAHRSRPLPSPDRPDLRASFGERYKTRIRTDQAVQLLMQQGAVGRGCLGFVRLVGEAECSAG